MQTISNSPPRAPPIKYTAPLGTRWAKEKAAAGGSAAFDLPTDPKSIGPWILGECVGKGASGRVKIAKHRRTGELAAVKILPIAPLVNSRASLATQQAKFEKQRLGIDREITMMKLMNHPNIMRIYDVYEGEKELFLVLEYIEGGELFDFLVNRGRLPPAEALQHFRQIIYGLNYAHTFSIIHRDLKPENILIASLDPPVIKIADWGMAAFAPPTLQLETSCGSPHYASPEIVNGEKYHGNATDIWSCGVILYALLTGRLPFDDKNVRTLLSKVKSGKYEMPAWIDPLAKDLLTKMLVVDVKKRITIPEILAHPWVSKSGAQTSKSITDKVTLQVPPLLPPSPSTLAKPIASPRLIDPELFSSLRIIWGRHADPQGASIQRDLCSPAGQGMHAKAFYFLLNKYREQSSRNRSHDAPDAGKTAPSDSDVNLQTVKFNLGWELDQSRGIRKHDVNIKLPSCSTSNRQPLSVKSDLPLKSPFTTTAIDTNRASRSRSITEGTSNEASSSHIGSLDFQSGKVPTEVRRTQLHAQSSTPPNVTRPTSSPGIDRGVPRAVPPRRGNTYSATQAPFANNSWRKFDSGVTSLPPVHDQQPRRSNAPAGHLAAGSDYGRRAFFMVPPTPCSSFVDTPDFNEPEQIRGNPAVPCPVPVQTSAPMDVDLPLLMSPKTSNLELQKTMDGIVDKVNVLVHAATNSAAVQNVVTAIVDTSTTDVEMGDPLHGSSVNKSTASTVSSEVANRGSRIASRSRPTIQNNKENQSASDESWTHVNAEEEQAHGLGLGVGIAREIGKEIGNATTLGAASSPAKNKKDKERKSRPPPLNLPSAQQTRNRLGSPIHLASPMMHGPMGSTRIMASPMVGEFKGWFSNLFSWKAHHSSSQSCIFYSFEDLGRTRNATITLFQSLGFTISRTIGDHQSERAEVYHCRLDQLFTDPQSNLALKPTRFRVEFISPLPLTPVGPSDGVEISYFSGIYAPSPNYLSTPNPGVAHRPRSSLMIGRSSSNNTPLPSPLGFSQWELPPGCACAIALAHEKGSMSSFRTVRQKLRETYGSSQGLATSPCFSPALPNTPLEDSQPRSAA